MRYFTLAKNVIKFKKKIYFCPLLPKVRVFCTILLVTLASFQQFCGFLFYLPLAPRALEISVCTTYLVKLLRLSYLRLL